MRSSCPPRVLLRPRCTPSGLEQRRHPTLSAAHSPPPPHARCCNAPGCDRPATYLGPLFVKTLSGVALELQDCHSIDTGYDLKLRLALLDTSLAVEDQRLIFAGAWALRWGAGDGLGLPGGGWGGRWAGGGRSLGWAQVLLGA